jgi:hypothetical protein
MPRASVVLVAGVCGLLVLAVALKEYRSSKRPEMSTSRGQVGRQAQLSGTERPGWSARPDAESAPGPPGGSGSAGRTAGRVAGDTAQVERGRSVAEAGAATVIGGRARGRGRGGPGSDPRYGDAAPIRVDTSVPAGATLEGVVPKLSQMNRDRDPAQTVIGLSSALPSSESGGPLDPQAEDNGPTLQLSFNNTTEPDKGDVRPVVEEGVTFNSDRGALFSADAEFVIPDAARLTGKSGTISFWIEPEWNGNADSDASLVQIRQANMWENRLQITKNGRFLRFLFTPETGMEGGAGADISNWQAGNRYLVTTTWGETATGEKLASLYINGQLVGQHPFDGEFAVPPGAGINIGSDLPGGVPGAQATLSDVLVYKRMLAPDEVASLASSATR